MGHPSERSGHRQFAVDTPRGTRLQSAAGAPRAAESLQESARQTRNLAEFIQRFAVWAQSQPDLLAVALVGSHARGQARPDSDVDLVLICSRAADYLADLSWTLQFGAVREHQVEDYGKVMSIRAWYENGLEVEYGITSLTRPQRFSPRRRGVPRRVVRARERGGGGGSPESIAS